jgi:alpha-beta hydrolase superfamily lysophospholipase
MTTYPFAEAVPPSWEGAQPSSTGEPIFVRRWQPAGEARGAVVIAHGLFEHSGRYLHVAGRLVNKGYQVWALDHYGHGRSAGPRGALRHDDQYLDDLGLIIAQATQADGQKPALLGHSMGGAIAARYAVRHPQALAGLVLSAPALGVHASPPVVFFGRLASHLFPSATMPSGLRGPATHNPAWEAWKQVDPLQHNRLTLRLARFIVEAGAEARAKAGNLCIPVLLLLAGEDTYVDNRGAHDFFARLPAGVGALREYAGFYHELFNEVERDRPLADLEAWLAALWR